MLPISALLLNSRALYYIFQNTQLDYLNRFYIRRHMGHFG